MRQIHPTLLESVDIPALYRSDARPPLPDRPWVLANMVTSVDGGTAVDGLSGALGGDGDKEVFRAVRALADVIVVGAGTAVAEDYGPPVLSPELIAIREAHGQQPLPSIAVISNSLGSILRGPKGLASRLFTTEEFRPLVVASGSAPADRVAAVRKVADVEVLGQVNIDMPEMFALLRNRGASTVLVEGGPTLNGQLIADDLIDEVVMTMAPALVAGTSKRFAQNEAAALASMRLARVLEHDSHLFLRYVRERST